MVEVTDTLAAARNAAHDAGADPRQLSALRKEITRHVGRAGRMRLRVEEQHDVSASDAGLLDVLAAVPQCECRDGALDKARSEAPEDVAQRAQSVMRELDEYIAGDDASAQGFLEHS